MSLKPDDIKSAMSQMADTEGLTNLAELGEQLVNELAVQEELIKAVEESEKAVARLREVLIPELMAKIGVTSIGLPSGGEIVIDTVYGASLPVKDEERVKRALAWLRANGHEALIKNVIGASFGKGEDTIAEKLKVTLRGMNLPFFNKESVHHKTLESFVKSQYEKGLKFPEELFGAFTKTIAVINNKK